MNSFVGLVVGAVVIGGALAGAFLAGMTMGKGDTTEAAVISLPTPTVSNARAAQDAPAAATNGGEVDIARLAVLQQKFRSGELTEAEAEEFRTLRGQLASGGLSAEQLGQLGQRFGGGAGGGGGGQRGGAGGGFGGRGGGLRGAITEIAPGKLTIETPQGPLTATVGADTVIRLFVDGTLADLTTGVTVTVGGERGEDGGVQAATITVVPEGALGGFGGGFGGGGFGGGGFGGGGGDGGQ